MLSASPVKAVTASACLTAVAPPAVRLQIAKWCHENRDPETGALPDLPTEEAGGSRIFLEPPRAIPMAPLVSAKGGKGAAAKGKAAAPAKKAAGKDATGKGGKCSLHVYFSSDAA